MKPITLRVIQFLMLSLLAVGAKTAAADRPSFSTYTIIPEEVKSFHQDNRSLHEADSSFLPGVLSFFGNSLTIEYAFMKPIPSSAIGAVPGTDTASYSLKCAGYGASIPYISFCLEYGIDEVKPEVVVLLFGTVEARGAPQDEDWSDWADLAAPLIDSLLIRGIVPIVCSAPPLFEHPDTTAQPVDTSVTGLNAVMKTLARDKNSVFTDVHQAFMDYTDGAPFSSQWYYDRYVHPSTICPFDTLAPQCGTGIMNATVWHAINKVYRIIVDDGPADDVAVAHKRTSGKGHRLKGTSLGALYSISGRKLPRGNRTAAGIALFQSPDSKALVARPVFNSMNRYPSQHTPFVKP